ncbi:unnamed protein product [Cuscuta europaea]|uniref:MULE transposase domain-containing protein n=1 Tax=Cuscuta europaea TaxID=41803 RepID=A0A9P0ZC73_CUSEU|nr:unnamed protein product [Cuscuta europaea]
MISWARVEAQKRNMILTIAKSRPSNSQKLGNVLLACEKFGKYRTAKKIVKSQGVKQDKGKKASRTKKSDCPFALYGREVERNLWQLQVNCGFHNHAIPTSLLGHAFAGKLTKHEISLVRDLSEAGCKPKPILQSLKMANSDNVTSRKQVYNVRCKLKKEWKDGRTVMQQLLHLISKYDYFEAIRLVPGSEDLHDMIFAHRDSLQLLHLFPYVLIMDTTYKTNRYKMPFLEIVGFTCTLKTFSVAFAWMGAESAKHYMWVLNELKVICPRSPLAIVTDRELGLIKALSEVFPESKHLLCMVHVKRNIEDKALKLSNMKTVQTSFSKGCMKLFSSTTVEQYEEQLEHMRSKWKDSWAVGPDEISY